MKFLKFEPKLTQTAVGDNPYEEIKRFMGVLEDVTSTAPVKEDILGKLKLAMEHVRPTLSG